MNQKTLTSQRRQTSANQTMQIPAPKFELYQSVLLHWSGVHATSITRRSYDPDEGDWTYGVNGAPDRDRFFESALEPRD